MTSDEERREVARRLRGDLEDARSSGHYCIDSETVRYICDILGFRCSRCPHPWTGLEALADIIEPSCDRDLLLELVKVLRDMGNQYDAHKRYELGTIFRAIAACIREALGVDDG